MVMNHLKHRMISSVLFFVKKITKNVLRIKIKYIFAE